MRTRDNRWSRSAKPWQEWEAATTWDEALDIAEDRIVRIVEHLGYRQHQHVYWSPTFEAWIISSLPKPRGA